MHYTFTLLDSEKPSVVSKVFTLDEQSKLSKSVSANISQAKCRVVSVNDLVKFGALLERLHPNQCLIYGIPPNGVRQIVTAKNWETAGKPIHQAPRVKELFQWPSLGGILMLDYDAPKDGTRSHKHGGGNFLAIGGCSRASGYTDSHHPQYLKLSLLKRAGACRS
ncbi:hypothetical protein [Polynucleobacter sphagniphilus]|uniref:hypothetical protein n=1 Tax=Polynucleobacter sphagniphilus TaxID=1743169 RepID=UPI002472FAFC|nr:hypothetical protein [Polynucleobacter sphagniphilus]